MLCLVNEVKEQMQGALLDVLYKRDDSGNMSVENLLEEDADYTRQKKRCQEFLHLVRSASTACCATIRLLLPVSNVITSRTRLLTCCLWCSSAMRLVSCARCRTSGVDV